MQYTALDIKNFVGRYEASFTHVIVAHTHFRPYINPYKGRYTNQASRIASFVRKTKIDCRYALNCFNALLYPGSTNKARRHPELYRPLTFVTIEGAHETTDRALTIHLNITLGNLPRILNTPDIEILFRHAWHDKAKQSSNVKAYSYQAQGNNDWTGYTLKEAQQASRRAWETDGVWDVDNCWIPHAALAAD